MTHVKYANSMEIRKTCLFLQKQRLREHPKRTKALTSTENWSNTASTCKSKDIHLKPYGQTTAD